MATADEFDIAICGGSFVGLALARALTAMAPRVFSIALIEQRDVLSAREGAFDGRSAAIIAGVKAMLEVIGVWPHVADDAQPVERIELTDGDVETAIRLPLLALDAGETAEGGPTAYIVENAVLRRALFASLDGVPDLTFFAPDSVAALSFEERARVTLSSGKTLKVAVLVAADGQRSRLRQMAGITAMEWPSAKTGIVATLGIERPHDGVARQHFLPAGPFAILPMTGKRVSIVWTEHAARARDLLAGDPKAFLRELSRRAGPELGALSLLTNPSAYPLSMTLAREFVRPKFALAGDAAHGLHWIAGQGLNHGMKDVAALAETLIDSQRLGLDIGSPMVLKRYERWRRFDSTTSALTAAALNRIFSNNSAGLRTLRATGLAALSRSGRLRQAIMKEAAGRTGDLPKLLDGQPL